VGGGDKGHIQMLFWSINLKFRFFSCNDSLWFAHHWNVLKKLLETHESINLNIGPGIGSKRTLLGKAYGIKWGAFGNILGNALGTWWTCWEHIGNLMWTQWGLDGNTLRTKNIQKSQQPTPSSKEKKTGSIGCMLHELIWRGRISILNYLCSSRIFA
jgi:hypothetical protein